MLSMVWLICYSADSTLALIYLVVKNPLSPAEHPGGIGVDCELFQMGVDKFVVGMPFAFSGFPL